MNRQLKSTLWLVFMLPLQLWAMDASITWARFYPSEGSYVEVYINVLKNTLELRHDKQNGVEVLITFDDGQHIAAYNKYMLSLPDNVQDNYAQLIDLQRFGLKTGSYTLKVEMIDLNDVTKTLEYESEIVIQPKGESIISDILLASAVSPQTTDHILAKSGVVIEPLMYNFIPESQSILPFYFELYNTDEKFDEDFLIHYSLWSRDNVSAEQEVLLEAFKRVKPQEIIPLLLKLDLMKIRSGNYELKVQVMDRYKNVKGASSIHVIQSNQSMDYIADGDRKNLLDHSFVQSLAKDKLDFYIKSINPIISVDLKELLSNTVSSDDVEAKKFFIFKYWDDNYGDAAAVAFAKYTEVARVVDESFNSGFGYGFETDRGYMYLKYGQPDDVISVEDEPSAPPYEIWVYNSISQFNQTNVKFLFYNPSLATNDFILLHSTCRGERFNPAWEIELYRDATSEQDGITVDSRAVSDNLNRNAKRYFNDY